MPHANLLLVKTFRRMAMLFSFIVSSQLLYLIR